MKKIVITLLLSSPLLAQASLIFEDHFETFVVREFADGASGGAISRAEGIARSAGESIHRSVDRWGMERSGEARERMRRSMGHKPDSSRVYGRGGKNSVIL